MPGLLLMASLGYLIPINDAKKAWDEYEPIEITLRAIASVSFAYAADKLILTRMGI